MNASDRSSFFEALYQRHAEPWDYSRRAAEILRHEAVAQVLGRLCLERSCRVLDVGCSQGQLTRLLARRFDQIYAVDLSATALQKAEMACRNLGAELHFKAAGAGALPFEDNFFDALVLSDGIAEWYPDRADWNSVLTEAARVLRPGARAIFTDYLHPRDFADYVRRIQETFSQVETQYLNDRLWYQLESAFKSLRDWPIVRNLLKSTALARALRPLSALRGPAGSRHVLVTATKK